MLRLDQRPSGIWRIRGTHHGVSVDQSARTRSRTEAEAVRQALERKIFEQVHGVTPEGAPIKSKHLPTFAEAAIGYMQAGKGKPYDLERVIRAMGDVALDDITQGYIDRIAQTKFPDITNSTRLRAFYAPVGAILKHAQGERLMSAFQLQRPRPNPSRTEWRTPAEAADLIGVMRGMSGLTTFYFGTGLRLSEATRLKWKDISPDAYFVRVTDPKSTRGTTPPRTVRICSKTRAALPKRRGREDYVFTCESGDKWSVSPDGKTYGPRRKMIRRCRQTEIPHTTPHILRHSWASWLYSIERDTLSLMREGGWKSLDLVQRYTHIGTPDLGERVKAAGWFNFGQNLGNISTSGR